MRQHARHQRAEREYRRPSRHKHERNGLVTYDREVMKIPRDQIQRMNVDILKGSQATRR